MRKLTRAQRRLLVGMVADILTTGQQQQMSAGAVSKEVAQLFELDDKELRAMLAARVVTVKLHDQERLDRLDDERDAIVERLKG